MPTERDERSLENLRRDVDNLKRDNAFLKSQLSEFRIEARAVITKQDDRIKFLTDCIEAMEDIFACGLGLFPSHPLSDETRQLAIKVNKNSHSHFEGSVSLWNKVWILLTLVIGAAAGGFANSYFGGHTGSGK